MKLAIFGNSRSGTSLLALTLYRHLVASGENERWSHISEAFSTARLNTNLVIEQDGHLEKIRVDEMSPSVNYDVLPQDPMTRFMKFLKYSHQDYVVKFMPHDTDNIQGIVPWMRDNYRIIAIERRNPVAAFISALIANKHSIWDVHITQDRPNYIPFVVDMEVMKSIGYPFIKYYQYRDDLNPTHILRYEDIANTSPENILRMVDMVPLPDHPYSQPTTIKLHSFQEKMDLILNLDEVVQYFESIMKPYDVTMEYNNL